VIAAGLSLITLPAAADWYVMCDRATGDVKLEAAADGAGLALLAGPFPGTRTAGMWVQEHHPDGRCSAAPAPTPTETPQPTGRWIAVCARSSGAVEVVQGSPPPGTMVLWGKGIAIVSHADRSSASSWTHQVCPSWQCDASGSCDRDAPPKASPPSVTWEAGELLSAVYPPAPSREATAAAPAVAGPAAVLGPGTADLAPLVQTATGAATNCAYPAALASAEHMMNFDPHHPWLEANHDILRELAARQKATERAAWQASSELQAGELKRARELAGRAADTAVSCQRRAVSALLHGIDTAIEQQKQARNASRSRAAAALLPGLIDLAGVISGAQSGNVQITAGTVSSAAAARQLCQGRTMM